MTTARDAVAGEAHGWAPTYPYIQLSLLAQAVRVALAGRSLPRPLVSRLEAHASDARIHAWSNALHVDVARVWRWVALPARFGVMPGALLGAGVHARLLLMNTTESLGGMLALAARDKGMGRDLLVAHGLPVAPGAVVTTPAEAVEAAVALGFPVVVKRMTGGNSDGVAVGLADRAAVRAVAWRWLRADSRLLVEAMVRGAELRLHFVAGRLHRVLRATPHVVTGDGRRSIKALLARRHRAYLRTMSDSAGHRDRLVTALWAQGVRRFDDIARVVPAAGVVVRVSAATGAGMQRVRRADWLRPADVAALETLLARYGSPSGGIDLILRARRAPLASHGAILDVNVPSGFAYLDDPIRTAAAELAALVAHDVAFRRSGGRIPVWLVLSDGPAAGRTWTAARREFRQRYPGGSTLTVESDDLDWIAVLNRPTMRALLLRVSAAAIARHGIPVHLRPVWRVAGRPADARRDQPGVAAMVANAGGRLQRMSAERARVAR